MFAPLTRVAFGLVFIPMAFSKTISPRQEQCDSLTNDAAHAACAMKAAFGGSSVLPQILPDFSPKASLGVTYGNVVVGGAQQLSPAKVSSQPALSLSFISNSTQDFQQAYAILGLDYLPQTKEVHLFWIQSGLRVDKTTGTMTSPTTPILPYKSPNPSQGSGTHEYILFVVPDTGMEAFFKQNSAAMLSTPGGIDFQSFATLTNIGSRLVAGSYFKSTYDGIPISSQTPTSTAQTQAQQVSLPVPASSAEVPSPASSRAANVSSTAQASSIPVTAVKQTTASPSSNSEGAAVQSATQKTPATQVSSKNQSSTVSQQNDTDSTGSAGKSIEFQAALATAAFVLGLFQL